MIMKRRVPKVADLAPLMQFKKPQFDAKKRRLDAALTIDDLRTIAKRRTPKAAFDYTDGSAEAELSSPGPDKRSPTSNSTRRSCVTCPRSTPRAPSWADVRNYPSESHRPASPA